jgi:hypothetical protein
MSRKRQTVGSTDNVPELTTSNWVEKVDEVNYKHICNDIVEALEKIATPEALSAIEKWQHEHGIPLLGQPNGGLNVSVGG